MDHLVGQESEIIEERILQEADTEPMPLLPHIVFHLVDDWGWANAGWHANPRNQREVRTPRMSRLVADGIELDRAYSYQYCSPTRCSLQSGRYPTHVNDKNLDVTVWNPEDPVRGFAGMPRNMTGIASKLKLAGYRTHQVRGSPRAVAPRRAWV